jgi:hypothetical protein
MTRRRGFSILAATAILVAFIVMSQPFHQYLEIKMVVFPFLFSAAIAIIITPLIIELNISVVTSTALLFSTFGFATLVEVNMGSQMSFQQLITITGGLSFSVEPIWIFVFWGIISSIMGYLSGMIYSVN